MKKLHLVFAALGLIVFFSACDPVEDVNPQFDKEKIEQFNVKSTEDGPTYPRDKP